MGNASNISDSEWEIMRIIWKTPNCTASEIIEQLKDSQKWKPKTVKTLISRLISKNIIGFEQTGREYKYYPLLSEQECIKIESKSFLHRVYNGSIKSMLLSFIEEENLTKDEIEELKSFLNERKSN